MKLFLHQIFTEVKKGQLVLILWVLALCALTGINEYAWNLTSYKGYFDNSIFLFIGSCIYGVACIQSLLRDPLFDKEAFFLTRPLTTFQLYAAKYTFLAIFYFIPALTYLYWFTAGKVTSEFQFTLVVEFAIWMFCGQSLIFALSSFISIPSAITYGSGCITLLVATFIYKWAGGKPVPYKVLEFNAFTWFFIISAMVSVLLILKLRKTIYHLPSWFGIFAGFTAFLAHNINQFPKIINPQMAEQNTLLHGTSPTTIHGVLVTNNQDIPRIGTSAMLQSPIPPIGISRSEEHGLINDSIYYTKLSSEHILVPTAIYENTLEIKAFHDGNRLNIPLGVYCNPRSFNYRDHSSDLLSYFTNASNARLPSIGQESQLRIWCQHPSEEDAQHLREAKQFDANSPIHFKGAFDCQAEQYTAIGTCNYSRLDQLSTPPALKLYVKNDSIVLSERSLNITSMTQSKDETPTTGRLKYVVLFQRKDRNEAFIMEPRPYDFSRLGFVKYYSLSITMEQLREDWSIKDLSLKDWLRDASITIYKNQGYKRTPVTIDVKLPINRSLQRLLTEASQQ